MSEKTFRFEPRGFLALNPKALSISFEQSLEIANVIRDNVATVAIRGPLMHHEDFCFDSYEAIVKRVSAAIETRPRAIVLAIDSPGGLVAGMLDTAATIRGLCAAARVPLVAHVQGDAASAAYALACSASKIVVSGTGLVGSIGVIDTLVDLTQRDALTGVSVKLITSGARKADGNPHAPTTDAAVAVAQQKVDYLAEQFFAFVAASRGLSPDAVRGLEAAMLTGANAVGAKLADEVGTIEDVIGSITGKAAAQATTEGPTTMATYKEAIEALRKSAEGEGEEAESAKKMLAALEPPAEDGDKKAEDAAPPAKDDEKAADETPPPKDDEKKDDAKAMARAALALATSTERRSILASRTDLPKEIVASLQGAELETVRKIVAAYPRTAAPKLAAASTVSPLRGDPKGSSFGIEGRLPEAEKTALDARMGLGARTYGVVRDGNRVTLGAPMAAGKTE